MITIPVKITINSKITNLIACRNPGKQTVEQIINKISKSEDPQEITKIIYETIGEDNTDNASFQLSGELVCDDRTVEIRYNQVMSEDSVTCDKSGESQLDSVKCADNMSGHYKETHNRITFRKSEPLSVTLFRSGELFSVMYFDPKKARSKSILKINEQAGFSIEVFTTVKYIKNTVTENGGEIILHYLLDSNVGLDEYVVFEISVKPVKDEPPFTPISDEVIYKRR